MMSLQESRGVTWLSKLAWPVAGLGAALSLGLLAADQPLLAAAAGAVAFLAFVTLVTPDVPTLLVLFILYTNAAVVVVRFHHVPETVGAALPVLLIIPLAYYLVVRREPLIVTPVLPFIIFFLAIQVIGALFSTKVSASNASVNNFLIEGVGLYVLLTNVIRTPAMLRRATWVLLIAGTFLGALSIYQQITHTYSNNYWGFAQMSNAAFETGVENLYGAVTQRRLAGPIGEQNRYAQTMLMLVPLGMFRFWGERSKLLRALALIATGVIAAGVALTFSRGAAVGLVLMLVITAAMGYIKPHQFIITVLGLILLLQLLPQYGARLSTLEDLSGAVTSQGTGGIQSADNSTRSRLTEMLAAVLVFVDHPVVGVGPGMFRYYYRDYALQVGLRTLSTNRQAHDLYVGIAAENGMLGLIAFGLIMIVALRSLAQVRRRWMKSRPDIANLATGFVLSLISYLATGIFLHFAYIRFFWLIMALAGAACHVATSIDGLGVERGRKSNETLT